MVLPGLLSGRGEPQGDRCCRCPPAGHQQHRPPRCQPLGPAPALPPPPARAGCSGRCAGCGQRRVRAGCRIGLWTMRWMPSATSPAKMRRRMSSMKCLSGSVWESNGGQPVWQLSPRTRNGPFHRPPYCLRQQGPTPADGPRRNFQPLCRVTAD